MYAVLEVPDFALVAARRLLPQAVGAAVLAESLGRQSKVLQADAAALAAGVQPGMPVPRAQSRCEGLHVVVASPAAEKLATRALLLAAVGLAPRVEQGAPGCLLIDLKGRRKAEIGPAAEVPLTALHRQDLPARMGLAATPGLAAFAARSTRFLLAVDDAAAFLGTAPVSAAAVSPALAAILRDWGIKTLGMFAGLSRESLAHRFGPEALGLWDACHGRDARPVDVIELPPHYRESVELDYAIETLEPLLFILRRLAGSLCLQLEARQEAATRIVLTLHLDDRTDYTFDCKLPEPTQQADTLFRTLQAHLDTVRTGAPVVSLRLELLADAAQAHQGGLFDTAVKDPARFADTLDRLAAIVGPGNVGTPRVEDTHQPDALRMERLPQVIAPARTVMEHQRACGLPLRRCRPPLPARVRADGNGAPMHVHAGEIRGAVASRSGPFHGSGHWWEAGKHWRREEWDVELADHRLLRLLCTQGTWFIEGSYA